MQPAHYTPHTRRFLGALTAWLRNYEFVAIWLEGIALVAIFVLDWRERRDQRKERREQHRETAAQFDVSQRQVEAAKKSADAATEAARAAKISAEASATFNRPFIGLVSLDRPRPKISRNLPRLRL